MEATKSIPFQRQYPHDYLSPDLVDLSPNPLPLAAADTSLDTIETSIHRRLPSRYNEYRAQKHQADFTAVSELYAALDEQQGKHRLSQLKECRAYAWFAWNERTGKVKVISNACRLRWCPVCAESRRMQIRSEVSRWLKTVKKPRFITLTMQHSALPLASQIEGLYKSFRMLRRHKSITKKCRGGVWFFQIKRSKNDAQWHPHLHIVVDSDYINQKELSLEWFEITGNSYIVDVRAIKDPGKVADYVSRYCAVPCNQSDFSQPDRIEIATVLHGKRLCGSFGSGAECDFTARSPEKPLEWKRCGNWTDIVLNRANVPSFERLLRAWQLNENLERNIFEDIIRQTGNSEPKPITIGVPIKSTQLCFEEFVKR